MKARFALWALMIGTPLMAQTSGAGFPPTGQACSASRATQTWLDTNTNLIYTCTNVTGVGYIWQLGQSPLLPVTSAPTGSCTAGIPNQQVVSTGVQYSCQNGTWGAINGGSSGSGTVNTGTAGRLAYYNAAGSTVSSSAASIDANGNINSPLFSATQQFVFEGDSRTTGQGATSGFDYPSQDMALPYFLNAGTKHNVAISGTTVEQMIARYAANVKPYCVAATASSPAWVYFFGGYNNVSTFGNEDGPTTYALIASYWATAKADGCKVAAFTIPPGVTVTAGSHETARVYVNTAIVAAQGTGLYDALGDAAAAPMNDYTNTTYFNADQIHFSDTGYGVIAAEANTAMPIRPNSGSLPNTVYIPVGLTVNTPHVTANNAGGSGTLDVQGSTDSQMRILAATGRYSVTSNFINNADKFDYGIFPNVGTSNDWVLYDRTGSHVVVDIAPSSLVNSIKTTTTGLSYGGILMPVTIYSAAGTALPSCAAGTKGGMAIVSDATTPTYLATYASGGAVVAPVMCNGTNWVTY